MCGFLPVWHDSGGSLGKREIQRRACSFRSPLRTCPGPNTLPGLHQLFQRQHQIQSLLFRRRHYPLFHNKDPIRFWATPAGSQRPGDLGKEVADEIQRDQMSYADCHKEDESNSLWQHSTWSSPWASFQRPLGKIYINTASAKATEASAFTYRNVKGCPAKVHSHYWKCLVRPMLEYASVVWDPHQKNFKSDFDKVQRWVARHNYNLTWFQHVDKCLCPRHQTWAATAWNQEEIFSRSPWYTKSLTILLTFLLHLKLFSQATEPPEISSWNSKYHIPGQIGISAPSLLQSDCGTLSHLRHRQQPLSMPSRPNWKAGQSLWVRQTTRTSVLDSFQSLIRTDQLWTFPPTCYNCTHRRITNAWNITRQSGLPHHNKEEEEEANQNIRLSTLFQNENDWEVGIQTGSYNTLKRPVHKMTFC